MPVESTNKEMAMVAKKALTPSEASVLAVLDAEAASLIALPRLTKLTPTEVRQAVEDLRDQGLVEATSPPADVGAEPGEMSVVRVTPLGHQLAQFSKHSGGVSGATTAEELDEDAIDEQLSAALAAL